jgi:hypothetical protein
MKKTFFAMIILLCFGMNEIKAQTQAVKLGPLGFLFGYYNARYEKKLNDKGSFQIGANYYNYDLLEVGTTGFGVDASYRLYFKEAIRGAYVAPTVGFDSNTTSVSTFDDTEGGFTQFGLGATVGYQWAKQDGFVFDLGVGYGYNLIISKDDALTSDSYGGGGPLITLAMGYAF